MASNVRQNRTLEAYCCLRGLPEASFASKNEVTSDFCLAPYSNYIVFLIRVHLRYCPRCIIYTNIVLHIGNEHIVLQTAIL